VDLYAVVNEHGEGVDLIAKGNQEVENSEEIAAVGIAVTNSANNLDALLSLEVGVIREHPQGITSGLVDTQNAHQKGSAVCDLELKGGGGVGGGHKGDGGQEEESSYNGGDLHWVLCWVVKRETNVCSEAGAKDKGNKLPLRFFCK